MRATILVAAVAAVGLATAALAADQRRGRYTMSPTEGGFLRLDTATGAVSLCHRKDSQWACEAVADHGQDLKQEVERLMAENAELKAEIKRLENLADPGSETAPGPEGRPERRAGKLQLPSEADVDRALDYLERMFRKFKDRLQKFERHDRNGTPL
jgi:hypothetical protein